MLNFLRQLIKPKYASLNKIEIKAANVIANYNYLKSLQPTAEIFPVLKANAYGHGLKELCLILNHTDAPLVVVDSFPEAQIVYHYFKRKVLILGEMPLRAYHYCRFKRTEFVVYNEETLKHLSRFGKRAKVHLFANSGMNREGIKDMAAFIAVNRRYLKRLDVVGLCSHLAAAEDNFVLNQLQENNFLVALDALRTAGFLPRWVHLGNSAALFVLKNKLFTAYRPGLALYGYDPFGKASEDRPLKPALEIYSHIVGLQELVAGEVVSYNEGYRALKPTRVAVIPFGYFEGLDRRLSNRAEFLVRAQGGDFWARVAGNICMNLTCLDLNWQSAKVGDSVQLISAQNEQVNSVLNLTAEIGMIPYEFLIRFQANIRREIV